MKAECAICSTPWEVGKLHRVDLTEKERVIVRATGSEATHFLYCPPCWKMMQDRQQGASFLAGAMEVGLRQAGVADAQEQAQKFRSFLMTRTATRRS